MTTTVAMCGSRDTSMDSASQRRHAPRDEEGAMEYPCGWTPVQVYESWDEERLLIESELELQIWRWALLEAHLWEASQVYESSWAAPPPREPKGNYCTIAWRSGTRPREGALWTHPVGTAAAPRGGAKEGELSSTKGAVPGFLVKVMVWSRPRSEGRGQGCGGRGDSHNETGLKGRQRMLYPNV